MYVYIFTILSLSLSLSLSIYLSIYPPPLSLSIYLPPPPLSLSIYLSIHPPLSLSIYPPPSLSIYLSTPTLSLYLSIYPPPFSLYLSIHPPLSLSLSIYLSTPLSLYLSIHPPPSLSLSIYPPPSLSLYLSIYPPPLSLSLYLSTPLSLSLYLSIYPPPPLALSLSFSLYPPAPCSQTKLPLTCLMPKRLQRPSVQLAFHTDVPGDQSPTYPSGLALHPRLLAVVDRENAVVKMFDRTSGSFLRTIGGDGSSRLVKPFDVVFLDKTGTTVAVSDSEAGAVRVFETLSGKFLRSFAGEIRHPRGLAVTPGTGQVVVVDGHLRHFTFHDPITGEMLRRLTPSFINNGRASCPADVGRRKDHGHDRDNDNTDNIRQYSGAKENSNTSLIAPEKSYEGKKHAPHDVSEHFKSTALIDPYYIAWTLSGNLVVTDQASPNLKIVDSETGDILSQSMDYGTGLEESLHPSGLCVDRYGQILISDTNNSRVHLALPNGQLTDAVLLRGDMKTDQAKDASKNQRKLLQKEDYEEIEQTHCLDADVSEIDHCSPSVSKPLCLAIDDDTGHLVVAQAGGQVKMIRYM